MNEYLRATPIINWQDPQVYSLAKELSSATVLDTARRCFEWVRDNIHHSYDFQLNPVTCSASEVLEAGTGFCYAKSHLLAALLRANDIPTGLCYQRLRQGDDGDRFCLHGLNSLFLPEYGWYRVDARGNKSTVNAQFVPPVEQLAFAITEVGEADLPQVWADPLPGVISTLCAYQTYDQLAEHLPDIESVPTSN
jgi:transglutaminase-like putative cysteine protease